MKIGVTAFLTEKSGNPGAIAAAAEHVGFESFWVAEHLVIPAAYTTYYPRSSDGKVPEFYAHLADPFVALAAAAQATSRIRVGTSVCLLPERNPIETAKAAATLDMYSGGRLMLGVGAGWFPEEAAIMGVDFKRRWLHLRESVEAMRELWSKPEASYEGEIIRFPPVRLFPKPVQKPYPPIFLGAHDPGPALKRVARWADGWMPGGLSP
ncbi:MAG TPA: TIGR03619 family F420-dependent LLM class oxidoreductase, partial [Candidatus Binataceae bacterium]|nr:TIGR03619 family F420-dependent LLM class oxidoreductase [Candidatus Binataceae bacterium]